MLLNPSIIYEELSKKYPFVSFTGSSNLSEYLRSPLLYIPGMTLVPGTPYVGNADLFFEKTVFPENCCLILSGSVSDLSLFPGTPVIMVRDAESVEELYNSVQSICEKINDWSSEIGKLVLNDADIQTILNVSRPFFPNTFLLVLDHHYNVLATTAAPEVVMDETGTTPPDVLSRFKSDPQYVNSRFREGTFLYEGKYFDHKILLHHLFINGEMRGTFSMAEHGAPFTDSARILFEHLALLIEHCYSHQAYSMSRFVKRPNEVFSDLLSGELPSDKQLSDTLAPLKWNPGDRYKVAYIAIREADRLIGTTLYLCRRLDSQLVSAFSMEYNGDIIILLNISRIGNFEEDSKAAFSEFLNQHLLSAGISLEFENLSFMRSYYLQAKAAHTIGSKSSPGPIHYFTDVRVDYMIQNIASEIFPETLCPSALLRLRDSDKTRGTEYIKTLDTYFRTGMNASRTAKLLYINRSTLLERLSRLWTQLEIDPDRHEDRLYLILCMKILGL